MTSSATALTPLTADESAMRAIYEANIKKGLNSFLDVGSALMAMREGKLYRSTHETFDDYCRQQWGMERTYAHRVMEAASVVEMLPMGNKPKTERQTRALTQIEDPEERAEAWQEAVDTSPKDESGEPNPTASHVEDVVAKRQPKNHDAPAQPPRWWREALSYSSKMFALIQKHAPECKATTAALNALETLDGHLDKIKKEIA